MEFGFAVRPIRRAAAVGIAVVLALGMIVPASGASEPGPTKSRVSSAPQRYMNWGGGGGVCLGSNGGQLNTFAIVWSCNFNPDQRWRTDHLYTDGNGILVYRVVNDPALVTVNGDCLIGPGVNMDPFELAHADRIGVNP